MKVKLSDIVDRKNTSIFINKVFTRIYLAKKF